MVVVLLLLLPPVKQKAIWKSHQQDTAENLGTILHRGEYFVGLGTADKFTPLYGA